MSRKALALAAFLFLGIGGTGAKADPILTPLIAAGLSQAGIVGGITIFGSTVAYASIATYAITAGAPHAATSLRAPK